MNISFIIPNYNGAQLLKKNLPEILNIAKAYKDGNAEVIVIDDHSTDNSLEILNGIKNDKLIVLKNDNNEGFSSAVNKGAAHASGDIIILLNTDVIPESDFLKPLLSHFDDESVFAVGCMDKSREGEKIVLRGRGIGKWERGFLMHQRGEVDKTNTLWVSGGSSAFRKDIWEKLGGFDQLYNPFYWEDIDLSYRGLKRGYKIIFEPKSMVVHEHEKGAIKKNYSDRQVKSTAYRNQFIFVWKNITDFDYKYQHLLWFPYHFLRALLTFDTAFFNGFFKAIVLLPSILRSRSKAQKHFIKSDKKVIESFKQ